MYTTMCGRKYKIFPFNNAKKNSNVAGMRARKCGVQ